VEDSAIAPSDTKGGKSTMKSLSDVMNISIELVYLFFSLILDDVNLADGSPVLK